MRGIYSVGGFNGAPPLEPKLGAFFWVTPLSSAWPKERLDSKLREYNDSGMQQLTVHEAMPGHYVQAEYANEWSRARAGCCALYSATAPTSRAGRCMAST